MRPFKIKISSFLLLVFLISPLALRAQAESGDAIIYGVILAIQGILEGGDGSLHFDLNKKSKAPFDEIWVKCSHLKDQCVGAKISISDENGKLLKSEKLLSTQGLTFRHVPKGRYEVEVDHQKLKITRKLIGVAPGTLVNFDLNP